MICLVAEGVLVVRGLQGGRGWHRDVQDRTPSCLLHNPSPHFAAAAVAAHTGGGEVRSFWGDYVHSGAGFLTPMNGHRACFYNAEEEKTNGMLSLSFTARSDSTEHWRHRVFTMSCLDVMYPAYGHYAPYAPTAPAFINSLQVGWLKYQNIPWCIVSKLMVDGGRAAQQLCWHFMQLLRKVKSMFVYF